MLVELRIENLGVIDEVGIVFGEGLTALTGETGAGKTMIVEAINLLVGQRADPGMVRAGADELRVEGRFIESDGREHVLCRVVPRDGRSRAYIDGRLATVGSLAELGAMLVDLHGQHEHQSLLDASAQRSALDAFGKIDLSALREARAELTEIDAALATFGGDERARAREIDLLRFQVQEIDAAGLDDPNEDALLEREIDLLQDAASYREALEASIAAVADDDGAIDRLGAAVARLGRSEAMRQHVDRLREAQALLDDVVHEMRSRLESVEEDPQRLGRLVERRQTLFDLRRKYAETIEMVMAYRDEAAGRLQELESWEERAELLDKQRSVALERLTREAKRVRAARQEAAPRLAAAVEEHLSALALANARVAVVIGDDEEGDIAGDRVTILLSANPGSEPAPLSKVASGGELARTMLALRLVLTQAPETLVFDEVDAGIGGQAAVAVAQALAELGLHHQVFVVTHLPQVAAHATQHIVVSKQVRKGVTFTSASVLAEAQRAEELARMISGGVAQDSAIEHAKNMLKSARSRRGARQ